MFRGIAFVLAACLIWSLIFVVPQFLQSFSAIEIAIGRYLFYGLISCAFFLKNRIRYPLAIWKKAIGLSFLFSVGYYPFVVLSLRYSTPAICALVLGITPIAISFYGNWRQKECTFRSLLLPSLLIVIGLVIINAPHLQAGAAPISHLLGVACALWALASWSIYAVANSRFLKENPDLKSSDWSTLLGVATLFWCVVFVALFGSQIDLQRYMTPSAELTQFLIGCAILGIFCSWVGAFCWNLASFYLPVSLAGQLTIFETIFGVIFLYGLEQRMPPLLESIGMLFLLSAVLLGVRQFAQRTTS